MTPIRMLDGTYCYTGVECHKHADAIRETAITQKQRKQMTKEEKLFVAKRQFDPEFNPLSYEQTKATDPDTWWKCPVHPKHRWQITKHTRQSRGDKCPFCTHARFVPGEEDLQTMYPQIARELHPTKNHGVKADQLAGASNKEMWWTCPLGHDYPKNIDKRTLRGQGCPYCANTKAWTGFNDLFTQQPDIFLELHPTLNPGIDPMALTIVDRQSLMWQCAKCGHEFPNSVRNRTQRGQGCKKCVGASSSVIESIFHIAASNFLENIQDSNVNHPITWRKKKTMTIDIAGTYHDQKVAIEYDGEYAHGKLLKDPQVEIDKTVALLNAGYKVVRIRENSLKPITMADPNLLQINYNSNGHRTEKDVKTALDKVQLWLDS